MIVVYEPFCVGLNHVPINSDFLLIISKEFPKESIVFLADKNHINNVQQKICISTNIIYQPINIIEPRNGKLKSIFNERKNIIQILKKYKKEMNLFFILNSHPHTMFFAKKYTNKKIPIIFVLHGNLEELKRKKRFYQLGYWIKPAFVYKKNRSNMKFIVLGESIKKNVLKYLDFINKDLIAVPHPYNMYENNIVATKDNSKIVLGMIGSFSPEKRSELIFSLEERIRKLGITNIDYLLVGADDKNGFPNGTNIKILGNGDKKLGDKEYNLGIEQLDYILFFWPNDSYMMTASGAIHDAIAHRKPIISIRNAYLTWVFEEVGDLGFLCNDFDELVETVEKISKGELEKQKAQFSSNYIRAEKYFSRDNVARIMNINNIWMIK